MKYFFVIRKTLLSRKKAVNAVAVATLRLAERIPPLFLLAAGAP
jgi:hypothetical protein